MIHDWSTSDRTTESLCQAMRHWLCSGASLFDARTMFDQDNPRADEVLRSIAQSLPQAVHTCLDAASADLEKPRQAALLRVSASTCFSCQACLPLLVQSSSQAGLVDSISLDSNSPVILLRIARSLVCQYSEKHRSRQGRKACSFYALRLQAACYGRAFCEADSFPRKRILDVCRQLRLVNALRDAELGICLTIAQLEAVGPEIVLRRLVKGHRHLLAYRAALMLGLKPSEVQLCTSQAPAEDYCSSLLRFTVQ